VNSYITYCARAKINSLIEKTPDCVAVSLTAGRSGGFNIDFLFSSLSISDIMISNSPKVFTDVPTLQQLKKASIDFDYASGDFIITKGSE
jgi:hypothetical protein